VSTSTYRFDVEMQYISEVLRQTKHHGRKTPIACYGCHSHCVYRKTFRKWNPRNI